MYLLFSIGVLLLLVFIAVLNLFTAPKLEKYYNSQSFDSDANFSNIPWVSVLVPARNEELSIQICIESILKSDYPKYEIIVADDASSDKTPEILGKLLLTFPDRLKVVRLSEPLPKGWTGKARACQKLSELARGEILIFCDADVVISSRAVRATVFCMKSYLADALTLIPYQMGPSGLIQAVVGFITQFSVLVTLPLFMVWRTSWPSLSMGNGQWFAWQKTAYRFIGGHESVKSSRIEDVALARRTKMLGKRLVVVVGARDVFVRMYGSWNSMRDGFVKNLFSLAGNSYVVIVGLVLFAVTCLFAPLLFLHIYGWGAPIGLMGLIFILIIIQRCLFLTSFGVLIYFPLAAVVALRLLLESAYCTKKDKIFWKDRKLPT